MVSEFKDADLGCILSENEGHVYLFLHVFPHEHFVLVSLMLKKEQVESVFLKTGEKDEAAIINGVRRALVTLITKRNSTRNAVIFTPLKNAFLGSFVSFKGQKNALLELPQCICKARAFLVRRLRCQGSFLWKTS